MKPRRAASGLPISGLCCPVVAFLPYVAHSPTYAITETHLPPPFQEFHSVCSGELKNTPVAPSSPPVSCRPNLALRASNLPPLSRRSRTYTLPGGLNSRLGKYSASSSHDCSLRAPALVLPGSSSLCLNGAFPECRVCLTPWFSPCRSIQQLALMSLAKTSNQRPQFYLHPPTPTSIFRVPQSKFH